MQRPTSEGMLVLGTVGRARHGGVSRGSKKAATEQGRGAAARPEEGTTTEYRHLLHAYIHDRIQSIDMAASKHTLDDW